MADCIPLKEFNKIPLPAIHSPVFISGAPKNNASLSEKRQITNQIITADIQHVTSAVVKALFFSFSSQKSCCTKYFWNPASANISAKEVTTKIAATIPNASGVSICAKIAPVTGVINFPKTSVATVHLVDFLMQYSIFLLTISNSTHITAIVVIPLLENKIPPHKCIHIGLAKRIFFIKILSHKLISFNWLKYPLLL